MGFRLFRIGNISIGEVKALSFRRAKRNWGIILYVVALWAAYIAVRFMGYDVHFLTGSASRNPLNRRRLIRTEQMLKLSVRMPAMENTQRL